MSSDVLETYKLKVNGRTQRIAARTAAQAAFVKELMERRARNARREQREAKRRGEWR